MGKSDEIRLHEIEKEGRQLGKLIASVLPEGVGFALHLFTFGEGGWSTFLSADHCRAMREFLEKAEGEADPRYHVIHEERPTGKGYLPEPSGPMRSFMTETEIRGRWPERADLILDDCRRLGYAYLLGADDD